MTLGLGTVVQGYHTHLTRSLGMGTLPLTLRHLLDLATAAQAAALAAVGPGVYLPGFGGARVDEVVIVTERAGDRLSEALNRPAST